MPANPRCAARRVLLLLALLAPAAAPSSAQNLTQLYVHDAQDQLAVVDVDSGAVTFVGDLGVEMTDIAFAADGRLFGLTFTDFYEIDRRTAETTLIGNHGIPSGNALVFAADGTLYGMGGLSTQLYEVDPDTGAATPLGSVGAASAGDLAFFGGELYLATTSHSLQRIDLGPPPSGVGVGNFGFSNVYGLATSDAGVVYGVAGTEVFSVNLATGAGTPLSDYSAAGGLDDAYGSSFLGESFHACPLTPVPGCRVVPKAKLTFQGRAAGREKLTLAMQKLPEATLPADFGDPVGGETRYEICLYDAAGDLAGGLGVARAGDLCGKQAKPCWRPKGDKGWLYKNPDASPSGVKSLVLLGGPAGKGKLIVKAANKAKKLQTALPASIGPSLAGETAVKVQLTSSDAECFEASLDVIKKAESDLFKGKTP